MNLVNLFEDNKQSIANSLENKIDLKWVNISISNLKRFLLGIYHVVKEKYVQHYLDEFCFKLNRRNHPNKFENLFEFGLFGINGIKMVLFLDIRISLEIEVMFENISDWKEKN